MKAVEPAGPLSVSKEGQWQLDVNDLVVKLDYARYGYCRQNFNVVILFLSRSYLGGFDKSLSMR